MKKSKKIIIAILSIICVAILVIIGYKIYEYCTEFHLDNPNKYLVTTDMKFWTFMADGGSHDNVYYGIDLEKGKVTRYIETVRMEKNYNESNEGSIIQDEINTLKTDNKNLTEEDVNKLEALLSKASLEEYNEEYENEKEQRAERSSIMTSFYYTVENMNYGEIKVYGDSFQEAFSDIVEKYYDKYIFSY